MIAVVFAIVVFTIVFALVAVAQLVEQVCKPEPTKNIGVFQEVC